MNISVLGICISAFLVVSAMFYIGLGWFDLHWLYELLGKALLCMWLGLGVTAAIFGVVINSKGRNE